MLSGQNVRTAFWPSRITGAYVVKANCSSFKVKIIHVILVNVPLYLDLS